jgi:hypothetical protein
MNKLEIPIFINDKLEELLKEKKINYYQKTMLNTQFAGVIFILDRLIELNELEENNEKKE